MRYLSSRKELKIRKKKLLYTMVCIAVVVGAYLFLTRQKDPLPTYPVVSVMPVQQQDVEIYGEYVGRIRAQQFVEVRARVEGFLEQMLFEEGTYVTRNQVLFVIDQRQYRAKADKARAQLKKDEAQARKAQRDLDRIKPLYEQNAASQLDLDNAVAAYETAVATWTRPNKNWATPSCSPPSRDTSANATSIWAHWSARRENRCWLLSSRATPCWWTSA